MLSSQVWVARSHVRFGWSTAEKRTSPTVTERRSVPCLHDRRLGGGLRRAGQDVVVGGERRLADLLQPAEDGVDVGVARRRPDRTARWRIGQGRALAREAAAEQERQGDRQRARRRRSPGREPVGSHLPAAYGGRARRRYSALACSGRDPPRRRHGALAVGGRRDGVLLVHDPPSRGRARLRLAAARHVPAPGGERRADRRARTTDPGARGGRHRVRGGDRRCARRCRSCAARPASAASGPSTTGARRGWRR